MKKHRKFLAPVGSHRPSCGGSCLLGHAEGDIVLLTYSLIIVPYILLVIFEGRYILQDVCSFLWIVTFLIWIICLYFLSLTYMTEPGIIPKGVALTSEQILNITETPDQKQLRQFFIYIQNSNYNKFDELLTSNPSLAVDGNNEGRTALHIAAFSGDYIVADRLLHHGAQLSPDIYSLTPMHYAAYEGHEDVVNLFLKHNHDMESELTVNSDVAESEETDEGDNGTLDNDNILDLMINKVKSELGPDLANLRGVSTQLPPYTGIPRSILVDGRVMSCGVCRTCYLNLPPRASHCRFCDCCVLKHDHHCPWVSNCIGLRNHRFFFLLMFFTVILMISTITTLVTILTVEGCHIYDNVKDPMVIVTVIRYHIVAVLMTCGCLITLFPVVPLFIGHLRLICHNMTTADYRKTNYKFVSKPEFDVGICKNLANELLTYYPSLLASTVTSVSKRNDLTSKNCFRKDTP